MEDSYQIRRKINVAKTTKSLPTRDEIPEERTWRLEDIFATDDEGEQAVKAWQADIQRITDHRGKLADGAQTLVDGLQLQDALSGRLGKLYTYAHMRADQHTTNTFYQALESRAETLRSSAASAMSFIVPEILSIDETVLNRCLEANEDRSEERRGGKG